MKRCAVPVLRNGAQHQSSETPSELGSPFRIGSSFFPPSDEIRASVQIEHCRTILLAARKKIQIFENGFLAEEDAEDVEREDAEDVERDEDFESDDVDEDPDVDDFATLSTENKTSIPSSEEKGCLGIQNICNNVALNLQNKLENDFLSIPLSESKDENCQSTASEQYVAGEYISANNLGQENMEIDESKSGDSWIQELAEGEYSDLSVEEHLNALVALIGVAAEMGFYLIVV
ncbi:hypothetical protein CIPAW_07G090300 [Carya illinoinensis]|uniref:WHIM1 domain-containing protein n=1 Tax=Carya illinoinensis TaxID=32201 RepID=A0A8T1Q189_CARIL|nr:hypothetical protein CIPAW_07G090300 [Carya illinoinensis]